MSGFKKPGLAIMISDGPPPKRKDRLMPSLSELLKAKGDAEESAADDQDTPEGRKLAMKDLMAAFESKDVDAALEAYSDLCELSTDMDDGDSYDADHSDGAHDLGNA